MDELVKLVTQKTGLDEKMAEQVLDVVVRYLRSKLPAPMFNQVESALKGETPKGASGIMGMLSGLFKR